MCTAAVHVPTVWSYRHGCRCPETVAAVHRKWRADYDRARNPQRRWSARRSRDIDDIAVERGCRGDRVELTIHERAEAVRVLRRRGLSARQIGERLGVCERTVRRYIHRLGTQPVDKVDASRSLPDDVDGGEVAA